MDTKTSPSTETAPIGRISDDAPPAVLPTLNPADSPYKPLTLPTLEPKQVPVPEQQPVQNLGATSKGGGVAYLADQILRGVMKGYDFAQQQKAQSFNAKLKAQSDVLNDENERVYAIAKAGRAGTFTGPAGPDGKPTFVPSEEYKNALARADTIWGSMYKTIGERIPQPKQSKKSQQGQNQPQPIDQTTLIQAVANHKNDPHGAIQAIYAGAGQLGNPVKHQVAGFLTPEYIAKMQQGAQTAATAATGQSDTAAAGAAKAKLEHDLATAVTSGAPAEDVDKIKKQLQDLQPTPVEKPITRPDTQEFFKPDGTKFVGQWDPTHKQWTYPNGEPIPQELRGKEAKLAPKGSASQWSQGLNAYAQSHKADPNDWQTIRGFYQEQFSAKNPLAERRLALAQRNSDINAASLDLRQSANDFNDMEKIFKQLGPDTKIQATAKAADEYTSHPTGPGDVALTLAFFETAKAADPGSGSGIRFTKQESDLIQHARGWADAAQANVEKWGKGTLYDGPQRKVMADLIKKAAQRSNEATASYLGAAQKINPRAAAAATGGTTSPVSVTLPDSAKAQLKEGVHTTFKNGQTWTLENGQPKQVMP